MPLLLSIEDTKLLSLWLELFIIVGIAILDANNSPTKEKIIIFTNCL